MTAGYGGGPKPREDLPDWEVVDKYDHTYRLEVPGG